MENLIENQNQLMQGIEQLFRNFKKDGAERKTPVYIKKRLETLDTYWTEFQANHAILSKSEERGYSYFLENHYQKTKNFYIEACTFIKQYKSITTDPKKLEQPSLPAYEPEQSQGQGSGSIDNQGDIPNQPTGSKAKSSTIHVSQGNVSKLEEMLRKQRSNFKAFSRTITSINLDLISEKWEFEDILQTVQTRWSTIDSLHWEIDSELYEEDEEYDQTYSKYEQLYVNIKKSINSKMWSVSHREKSTPKMDIPTFSGNYHQWVPFKDLFTESIHTNRSISSAQKMQFLKSKLRGEAERLIQHLNISTENYQVCWDILNHRYNNTKLIFTSHMNILLSLPTLQHQTAVPIKKMYDTTNESLNAIKNLGVDITTWDPMVVYILSQKLDSQTHNDYIDSLKNPRDLPRLDDFLEFLENKFTSLESSRRKQDAPRDQTRLQQESNIKKHHFYKPNSNQNSFNKSFTNNSIIKKSWSQKCPLCSENHRLFHCKTFLESTPDVKNKTVQKLNLCKNCLYDHKDKACFSDKRCRQCQGNHNTLLHDTFKSAASTANSGASASMSKEQRKNVTHVSNENITETLLATAQIKIKASNGSFCSMRALIDQGSQISLISENAAQRLGLNRQACKGVIFGVGTKENNCKGVINIEASAMHSNFTFHGDLFIMKSLINNLPNQSFQKPSWACLENIQLADPEYNVSRPIDVLFGADVYSLIIMGGIIKENENESQLVVQQTRLGWILCGNVRSSYQCNVVLNNIEDIQRFWAIEDVDNTTSMSAEDYECVQKYKSETFRREDGRYVVRLPLKPDIESKLGESKQKAVAQFHHLEQKFKRNQNIKSNYQAFINEYIALGHMQISTFNNNPSYYLPHHCVIRSDSTTTALRVVFNASAKTSSGLSLNDLMYRGPNLQQDLFTLILRWRQFEYAFTADIEKMFRQILCHRDDSQYQKIIWRDSPDQPLREYELMTVTYGTKAAPFLAMMTLKQLANDERAKYPAAAKSLEEDFFMDDLLSGHYGLQEAQQLQKDLIDLLKLGGFNLRKWSSNRSELLDDVSKTDNTYDFRHQESTKTLGLRWQPNEDQFTFQSKINISSSNTITKRSLLSEISKIFDPLGWLSPATTKLKLLFQRVWQLQIQWDDNIPEDIIKEWSLITQDMQQIHHISLPRWLESHKNASIELHGFCDSSTKAYACVIYCKIEKPDFNKPSSIILVAGKTRLVPINKNITLPRLELSAAYLLSKLMKTVLQCLAGHNNKIFAWSDSTAVLGWLQGEPHRWKPFVANRVKKITEIIPTESWHYVKSAENPADCASRGLSVEQLKHHSLWWHGPTWLSSFNENNEPKKSHVYNTSEEIRISAQTNITIQQQQDDVINGITSNYSSFAKATRILAWMLRALSRLEKRHTYLTINELRKAKHILIKHVQHCEFAEDIKNLQKQSKVNSKSKLLNLNPYLDKNGLLRVGGRISNARINENMQHPLIIPHSGHLTDLLIDQSHKITYHGGARLTLASLRQEYWILGGNRAVKKRIRKCIICRRHDPLKHTQIMGDLPAPRSNPTRPFHHTGVDFTGYVDVKSNKGRGIKTSKGYIAVFVCMATKAVHLELVSDLSSASFLAALRRMAARRGAPCHVYSDNGTNFVGASRSLRQEYINLQETLDNDFYIAITDMQIQWHFNAPSWPSAGGLWEAAVKSLKYHIKRVIGEQKFTYEEYSTLLAQLEACLNTRPLCALSEDPEDMDYLTPSHFLASGPTLTIIETERDARTRWQLTQKTFDDIWKRWRAEYLCQLSARSKWRQQQSNLQINDIVTINDANLPAGKWALGRIVELHPGKDGLVRVVSVKTKNGIIKRPITKLSLLPVTEKESLNRGNKDQSCTTKRKDATTNKSSRKTLQHTSRRTSMACSFIYLPLIFLLSFISTIACNYQISSLNSNQSLYFDKMSSMRLERDEWKLIVYYDMQPYWQGQDLLKKYINHLDNLCTKTRKISQCDVILMQLRHGRIELDHYNSMLLDQQFTENVRHKRGLINAVGNIARSLFGVLDEDFAKQYQTDIELVRSNQKHLASLWKNQTSVVEAENNIIKRVENAMDKNHKIFNQHLISLEKGFDLLQDEVQETLILNSFSMSSIIANGILMNLKSIQEALVDTIMNIHYKRFNIHLLTPEQLKEELNIIVGQLAKDLTLPIDNIQSDLSKMYHLLKAKARVMKQFIIFEVKIPLVSRESYEIYKIITIPRQIGNNKMINIIPIAAHIAINIHKDSYIPMSENEVKNCLQYDTETCIYPLKRPIYQMRSDENLCVIDQKLSQCKTESTICTNNWTELNNINTFLYFCCGQCTVRIICEYQVTAEQLTKAGIITLSNDCVIKGGTYTIYSHKTHTNSLNTKADVLKLDIPPINNIINLSIPIIVSIDKQSNLDHVERQGLIKEVANQLELMKSQDLAEEISYHDVHHYTVIYLALSAAGVAAAVYAWRRVRRVRSVRSAVVTARRDQHPLQSATSVPCDSEQSRYNGSELKTISGVISARNLNKATSPSFRDSDFNSE